QSFSYKPQLYRQGLILGLLPVSIGIAVLILLNHVWQDCDRVAVLEREQSEFVQHLNIAFNEWSSASRGLVGGSVTGTSDYEDRAHVALPKLRYHFEKLRMLNRGRPDRTKTVDDLQDLIMRELRLFTELPHGGSSLAGMMDLENFRSMQGVALRMF